MKKNFMQIFVSVVVLIVGTIVGTFVEKYRSESEGRIRYLDKDISISKSVLSQPKIPGKKLEVLLDGNPIKNIGQVTISIYNYSDKDYSQVPVYVELIPTSNKPLQIIGERAVGANDLPEAVVGIKNVKPPETTSGVRYGYEIKNVNRTSALDKAFQVSYLIEGDELPKADAVIDKKGLKLRDFSYENLYQKSWIEIALFIATAIFFVAAYIVAFVILNKTQRKRTIILDENFKNKLIEDLGDPEKGEKLGVDPLKVSDLSIYLLKLIQKERWERMQGFAKLLFGFLNPEKIASITKSSESDQEPHQG